LGRPSAHQAICTALTLAPPLAAAGRCRGKPLEADAVLVDEASMLSLPLAAALFDALRPRCQLVLVGDVDQLPPVGERVGGGGLRQPGGSLALEWGCTIDVPAPPSPPFPTWRCRFPSPVPPPPPLPSPAGPGSVLQSLIASRLVPVVDLREIFRQAAQSAIITSALAGGRTGGGALVYRRGGTWCRGAS
jgi:ATP-dependent exoDNAse (exonuclease V) alpha subunit